MLQQQLIEKVNQRQDLIIIHFNDVYDIQPDKLGKAGICNFNANINQLKKKWPQAVVLFSGDALSPSLFSNVFLGSQMVPAMNSLQIDCSVYGNHQFDLQPQTTLKLTKQCNFPWLSANIINEQTGKLLGQGEQYFIINKPNYKIGIFGVFGEDWLQMFTNYDRNKLYFISIVDHARRMVKQLQNLGCDFIIALTHMRTPCDRQLAQEVDNIDLILGGHDHIILGESVNNKPVIKSGNNFYHYSLINISKNKSFTSQLQRKILMQQLEYDKEAIILSNSCSHQNWNIHWSTIKTKIYPIETHCPKLTQHVKKCMDQFQHYDRIVGYTQTDLQARFSQVRTKETNYGNFLADMVRLYYDSDLVILNSGCIRNDAIIKKGPLYLTNLSTLFDDLLVVKKVSGSAIKAILQKSCSNCPHIYAGSFLLISGMKYEYDYNKTPRVVSVTVNNQPIVQDRFYTVAMQLYLANGGDGLSFLKQFEFTRDKSQCIEHLSLILKFFKNEDFIQDENQQKILMEKYSYMFQNNKDSLVQFPQQYAHKKQVSSKITSRLSTLRSKLMLDPTGRLRAAINPQLDGRIKCISI